MLFVCYPKCTTCQKAKAFLDAHPDALVAAPECNPEGDMRLQEYCPPARAGPSGTIL